LRRTHRPSKSRAHRFARRHDDDRRQSIAAESPKFGGVINETAKDSKPYWPPSVVPPKGAPNVLLIMTDDQGYGVSGTFGGVVPTPAMDRVANAGPALYAVFTRRRFARRRGQR